MRIVFFSDTHRMHHNLALPEGDVAVYAGDSCGAGYDDYELLSFCSWFGEKDFKHRIAIAGNHDRCVQTYEELCRDYFRQNDIIYLHDSEKVIDGIKFYGSPWQPEFCNWAFNLPRGEALAKVWAKVPEDTDVLITHGPPRGILDRVVRGNTNEGCDDLRDRILEVRPAIHVFGHIHESYGLKEIDGITYINASICTLRYQPINTPVVVDIHKQDTGETDVFVVQAPSRNYDLST